MPRLLDSRDGRVCPTRVGDYWGYVLGRTSSQQSDPSMTEKPECSERQEESETVDSAPCPFCGIDAVHPVPDFWTCSHLVARWALDPYDDGGGVAAEVTHYPDALGPGRDLGLALWELLDFIITGHDDAVIEERLERVRSAVAQSGPPPWWTEVESNTLANAWVDNLPGGDAEELGGMAGPIVESLTESVPGVRRTSAILGGMTSGTWYFLWSLERVAAAKGLSTAIVAATATVRSLIAIADNSLP